MAEVNLEGSRVNLGKKCQNLVEETNLELSGSIKGPQLGSSSSQGVFNKMEKATQVEYFQVKICLQQSVQITCNCLVVSNTAFSPSISQAIHASQTLVNKRARESDIWKDA